MCNILDKGPLTGHPFSILGSEKYEVCVNMWQHGHAPWIGKGITMFTYFDNAREGVPACEL